jgi:streptomycin 6-kinase
MNYDAYLEKYEIQQPQLLLQKTRKRLYTGLYHNKESVIKIATDIQGLQNELAALSFFKKIAPKHIPELYLHEKSILIMERIFPGKTLAQIYSFDDMQSMEVFCQSIEFLHKPFFFEFQGQFQSLEEVLSVFQGDSRGIPDQYFNLAKVVAQELLATTKEQVLLHGDLYHDNILYDDKDRWVVIDPKGVVGDPVYDLVVALSAPLSQLMKLKNPKVIIEERIAFVAKRLSYSEDRIRKWLFVRSVLSWLWALEDNEPEEWIGYFSTLAALFQDVVNL